jgi:hypothetical protein
MVEPLVSKLENRSVEDKFIPTNGRMEILKFLSILFPFRSLLPGRSGRAGTVDNFVRL